MSQYDKNVIHVLNNRAINSPDQVAFRFLKYDGSDEDRISYSQLDKSARRIAFHIRCQVNQESRVLLLFPPGLEYIEALFGCLYAGVIAVPSYLPTNKRNSPRINSIVIDSGASLILTAQKHSIKFKNFIQRFPNWLYTDAMNDENSLDDLTMIRESKEKIAIMQYSSGSTGTPKGVLISYSNLNHNSQRASDVFCATKASIGVSWLPPYHDMGLMASIIYPVMYGAPMVLLSPVAFVQQPFRWLKAISDCRATHSGAPDFAYNLCVAKITPEQKSSINLSTWGLAFTGAEPIHVETLISFFNSFKSCGFNMKAFSPCYGLAEGTLLVAGVSKEKEPTIMTVDSGALENNLVKPIADDNQYSKKLVSCGLILDDQEVLIVEPKSKKCCSKGKVGEIWVKNESVALGYWNKPEKINSGTVFNAWLDHNTKGPYLRTGDLGFLDNNELFITGRLKDLIIINGRNIYPQDVEFCTYNSHHSLRPNHSVAFSEVIKNKEQLVIVQELNFRKKPEFSEVFPLICQAVNDKVNVQVSTILIVKPGSIPLTSSGKVKRNECKNHYHSDQMNILAKWKRPDVRAERDLKSKFYDKPTETNQIRDWIIDHVSAKYNIPVNKVDSNSVFTSLGLESIEAVELSADLENWLGITVSPTSFWDYPTISSLSEYLMRKVDSHYQDNNATKWAIERTTDQPGNLDDLIEGVDVKNISDSELLDLLENEFSKSKELTS